MVGSDRHLHAGRVTESGVHVPQDPGQGPQFGGSALGRKESRITTTILCFLLDTYVLCQLLDSLFRESHEQHFLHHIPPPKLSLPSLDTCSSWEMTSQSSECNVDSSRPRSM